MRGARGIRRGPRDVNDDDDAFTSYFARARIAVCEYAREDAEEIARELRALGARVTDAYDATCTHVVTPFKRGDDYLSAVEDGKIVVSYAWIEDCVAQRRVVDAGEKALYVQLTSANGVRGFDALLIAVDGYAAQEKADIIELIEASGGTFATSVDDRTTHLVCYRAGSETYARALTSGRVAIVNHAWIEDCVREWAILPTRDVKYTKMGVELYYERDLER